MESEYLGKGLRYPFQFEKVKGGSEVSVSSSLEHEHIKESILQILQTSPGERLMNPEFGSRLKELVFENNTSVLKTLLRYHIGKALERWEKRIQITSIEFGSSSDDNTIHVLLSYVVIRSQVEGNLVYPFSRDIS